MLTAGLSSHLVGGSAHDQARTVLDAAPSPGHYARVDDVVRDGRLILMELEQIEPYLYFAEGPGSVERFVGALRARL